MQLSDARTLALKHMNTSFGGQPSLLDKGWSFEFDNAKSRLGVCKYRYRLISISRRYVEENDVTFVEDTILHEIAHAYAGSAAGHKREWKRWCLITGANPKRAWKGEDIGLKTKDDHKYQCYCTHCNKVIKKYHRYPTMDLSKATHTSRSCGKRGGCILQTPDGKQITQVLKPKQRRRRRYLYQFQFLNS